MTRQQLCVYTHSANGKVFYVGSGSRARAFNHSNRTPRWHTQAEAAGGVETNIIVWTEDRAEAQRIEAEMIMTHKPACNVHKRATRKIWPVSFREVNFSVRLSDTEAARVKAIALAKDWPDGEGLAKADRRRA